MKIYLDAMGGDNAPKAPAEGAREALERFSELEIELAGPMDAVRAAVEEAFSGADPTPVSYTHLTLPTILLV